MHGLFFAWKCMAGHTCSSVPWCVATNAYMLVLFDSSIMRAAISLFLRKHGKIGMGLLRKEMDMGGSTRLDAALHLLSSSLLSSANPPANTPPTRAICASLLRLCWFIFDKFLYRYSLEEKCKHQERLGGWDELHRHSELQARRWPAFVLACFEVEFFDQGDVWRRLKDPL